MWDSTEIVTQAIDNGMTFDSRYSFFYGHAGKMMVSKSGSGSVIVIVIEPLLTVMQVIAPTLLLLSIGACLFAKSAGPASTTVELQTIGQGISTKCGKQGWSQAGSA